MKYVDPDGEWVWLIPTIIGALVGGYSGYKIAEAKGATGWKKFGYIFGGAVIGGLAGYTGFSTFNTVMSAGTSAAGIGSGISSGFHAGLLSGMASGAITGGGMTALGGGSFSDVLFSATLGGWIGGVTGGLFGAVSGGVSNLKDQLNFWGTRLNSNSKSLLASADNLYYGPNNGWLPWITVRARNPIAAIAARELTNQAAKHVYQGAVIMTSVMSVGSTGAIVGGITRFGTRSLLTGVRGYKSVSNASLRFYIKSNTQFNYYKSTQVRNLSKYVWNNSSMETKKWIINNNIHSPLKHVYRTDYEIIGPKALKNAMDAYDYISNLLKLRIWP